MALVSEGQADVNLGLEVGCRVQVDIWDQTAQNRNKKISGNILFLTPCPGEGCRSSSSSVHHHVLFWFRGWGVADLLGLFEPLTFLWWIFQCLHSHWWYILYQNWRSRPCHYYFYHFLPTWRYNIYTYTAVTPLSLSMSSTKFTCKHNLSVSVSWSLVSLLTFGVSKWTFPPLTLRPLSW